MNCQRVKKKTWRATEVVVIIISEKNRAYVTSP